MQHGTPEQKKEWLPKIAAGAQFAWVIPNQRRHRPGIIADTRR